VYDLSSGSVSSDLEWPLTYIARSYVIRPIDALEELCAQLMCDLFAIAKFLLVTVTVTTVTCSAPLQSGRWAFQSSHSVPGVSSMKQKTLQFALEWSSRTQEFQVDRQPIPSIGCGNRESPVTNLPTRSVVRPSHSVDLVFKSIGVCYLRFNVFLLLLSF